MCVITEKEPLIIAYCEKSDYYLLYMSIQCELFHTLTPERDSFMHLVQ